jgi:dolichol-phosphate mannosyltransferase
MNGLPPAAVVIPTYNERDNLEALVAAVLQQGEEFRVLVVDDNSPDGTGDLACSLAARLPRLAVINRPGKQGIGTAYLTGFARALAEGADFVFEMDADFSHHPEDLPRLLAPVRAGLADVALGSRYVAGGRTEGWPFHRQILSRGGSFYARALLGLPVRDLTGGFKCFHRRVLASLPLDQVRASGYAFQIELTYRALQAGFRVTEVPITFTERCRGSSKMSRREITQAMTSVCGLRLAGERSRRQEAVSPLGGVARAMAGTALWHHRHHEA